MSALRAVSWFLSEPEVMELSGRLDGGTAPGVEEDAKLCIESGADRMVLDCGGVTYMTAAGLRAILVLAREMQRLGGRLAVCGLQPQAQEMFDICGLGAIIPVHDGQHEALEALAA